MSYVLLVYDFVGCPLLWGWKVVPSNGFCGCCDGLHLGFLMKGRKWVLCDISGKGWGVHVTGKGEKGWSVGFDGKY